MTRSSAVRCLLAVIMASSFVSFPVGPASAQRSGRLDLVSQTTFVDTESVEINLRVPSSNVPQQLEIRVGGPLIDLEALDYAYRFGRSGPSISLFTVSDLAERSVGSTGIVSIQLPDDEIGLILRRAPGVLPVTIDLIENGDLVDSITTSIIVDEPTSGGRLDLGFLVDTDLPLSHLSNGLINLDPEEMVSQVAEALELVRDGALVAVQPEALSALKDLVVSEIERESDPATDSSEGAAGQSDASVALARLKQLLSDHSLSLTPWVNLDEESWRVAGAADRVLDAYAYGVSEVDRVLGRETSTVGWLDADTTPETLSLLRTAGLRGAVVEAEQISWFGQQQLPGHPLLLRDEDGQTIPVLPINRSIQSALDGIDPELLAQQQYARLWLQGWRSDYDEAMVVDVSAVNPAALAALIDLVNSNQRVGTAEIEALLARDGSPSPYTLPPQAQLISSPPDDYSASASSLLNANEAFDSFRAMLPGVQATERSIEQLLRVALADELTAEQRLTFIDSIFDQVETVVSTVTVREPERITLAAKEAPLPVVIDNASDTPLSLMVRVSSDKLRFPNGQEFVVLAEPGITELSVPVASVGSGDARLQISVFSLDGELLLTTGAVAVRSTVLSGLGLIVTLIAGLVLLVWWARTFQRLRRTRLAASLQAPTLTTNQEGSPS
jgi:hypothetical protein